MRNAQVRIGETIAILFIFIVLVILGFMFYARIQTVTIQGDVDKSSNARAIQVAQFVSFLPELQCSANDITDTNCFDILKLEHFQDIVQSNDEHYFDQFLYSIITVDQIYPTAASWTVYNRTTNSSSTFTPVPVLLYNATSKKFNLGMVSINQYS